MDRLESSHHRNRLVYDRSAQTSEPGDFPLLFCGTKYLREMRNYRGSDFLLLRIFVFFFGDGFHEVNQLGILWILHPFESFLRPFLTCCFGICVFCEGGGVRSMNQ